VRVEKSGRSSIKNSTGSLPESSQLQCFEIRSVLLFGRSVNSEDRIPLPNTASPAAKATLASLVGGLASEVAANPAKTLLVVEAGALEVLARNGCLKPR